jgi:prevent-host-death family protein
MAVSGFLRFRPVPLPYGYDGAMRTVTALDVRKRFGEIVDQAAAGERIVIERAGQPIAALVPLSDLDKLDPESLRGRRLAALEGIRRRAARRPATNENVVELIHQMREERADQILRAAGLGDGTG